MLTDDIIQIGPDGHSTIVSSGGPGFSSDMQWYMYANWISDMVVVKLVILIVAILAGIVIARVMLGHRPPMMQQYQADDVRVSPIYGGYSPPAVEPRRRYQGPHYEANRQQRAITAKRTTVDAWVTDIPAQTRQPAPYRLAARPGKAVNRSDRRQIGS